MRWKTVAGLAAGAAGLFAQTVTVYSEFQRPGPDGAVIAADRQERPREILSPVAARNGYLSFYLVVSAASGTGFTLHYGVNPENAVRATVYRAFHNQAGIPDRLEPVELPLHSAIPEGRRAEVFWIDLWVDRASAAQRVRAETQVWIQDRWIVYPMEVRIYPNMVLERPATGGLTLPASSPADAFALPTLRQYLCGNAHNYAGPEELTARSLMQRNARQDTILARAYENALGREAMVRRLASEAGIPDAAAWCAQPKPARPLGVAGPEWYLKLRDRLVRGW